MSLLHVMRGPDDKVPFRSLCDLPIDAVDFWVSEKWARILDVGDGSPRCRPCWDNLLRRAVGSVIPKLGFRWAIVGTDLPIIRDQEDKTVLATLSTSYEHRKHELMPLLAMAPEFHDLIAAAVEHCDSCRMLPLDSFARCARCTSFLNALGRSRPAMSTDPVPTDVQVPVADPAEPRPDHGTYLVFSADDGRSQWVGPFKRIRLLAFQVEGIRPDAANDQDWWPIAVPNLGTHRWTTSDGEYDSFRIEVRPQP